MRVSVCVCVFDLVMYLMVKSDLRERVGVGVGVGEFTFQGPRVAILSERKSSASQLTEQSSEKLCKMERITRNSCFAS